VSPSHLIASAHGLQAYQLRKEEEMKKISKEKKESEKNVKLDEEPDGH